ncbi:MAG: hypothetical protein JRJ85_04465 [Deltaproteobacteria bacterium]|nr:hypothetical protein [Deltaproteobacteria bacterium]
MRGPVRTFRSHIHPDYKNLHPIYEWALEGTYLMVDKVVFGGKVGAILCYHNPPVHQIGTPGLYAYHDGLDRVFELKDELEYFILYGANDPVHTGGDLKESLTRLKETLALKKERESAGASAEDIASLFKWGEERLEKGIVLYEKIRHIARAMRVIGVCGGGLRFGGSAEIQLMSDYILGDSRSGMCFSEVMIGIIPGWGGIARILLKAGFANAAYMAKTGSVVSATDLKDIGIYNDVAEIPFPLPKREKTGNPEEDRKRYMEALEDHDRKTGAILLPKGLEMATCQKENIPVRDAADRKILASEEDIAGEVARRVTPENYAHLRGKTLGEVKQEMDRLGRPLAPQSIEALERLLQGYDSSRFD